MFPGGGLLLPGTTDIARVREPGRIALLPRHLRHRRWLQVVAGERELAARRRRPSSLDDELVVASTKDAGFVSTAGFLSSAREEERSRSASAGR